MTGGATRYEILEPAGAGLLGPYFKARDRELERLVLLWLLPPSLFPDGGERHRCLERAAAVAELQHPSLLPLYEAGETGDGGIFQAFAWAEGETLARRLEAGPLKPAVAIDLTAQIAAGLALAHEYGIVHGHLDPSSLLVTSSGEAKLLDLSASPGERTWTGTGGAPEAAWLSPEQQQGLAAGARSDVWGLGAMLYEMVTGTRPRSGLHEPLRTLRPDLSEDLERVVARALALAPADRPASPAELRRDLAALARPGSSAAETAVTARSGPQPSRIGHYRLLEPLGGGGMGMVYRAEDTRLGRTVALKLLPPELARDPIAKARFFQEARTASALEHPNLCTLYDAGEAGDGRLWLAMPCYDGETLRSRLRRGPLPVDEAVDVARQVALGLAKAHRQGIVHRDIKPANLMLTGDGVIKILDFGIAKLAGEAGITRPGLAIGTPGYMSPEQALGGEVDHRTDLWALGAVLYEMLAGRRPFPGELGPEVLSGILNRTPEPLAPRRPEIPPRLEEIVGRLLAKEPEARYPSAEEVAADLRSLLGPASAPVPAARPPVAGPSRGLWAMGILLALLITGGLAAWLLRPSTASPGALRFQRLTEQEGIELFPSLSPAGDFFVYAKKDGGDLDIFLQGVGGTQPINLTAGSTVDDTQPAFSPDGSRIAFRSERDGGGLFVMGATGESVRRLASFGYQPAWSPDGREIACSTASVTDPLDRPRLGQIWRVDVTTGQRRLVAAEDAVQPSWSPEGSRIAFWGVDRSTGKRSIRTILASGRDPVLLTGDASVDWNPVWSPDGSLYFISDRSGSMNLWRIAVDPRSGKPRSAPVPLSIPAQWAGFPSFSADGRQMAWATRVKSVNLERLPLDPRVPRVTGEAVPVTRGTFVINYASVSPDGARIVLSLLGDQEDLVVVDRDGGPLRRLTDDSFKDRLGFWAPDGGPNGRIVFYSNRRGQYNAWSIDPDGSNLRQLTANDVEPVFHPVPSPDGKAIAVCWGFAGAAIVDLTRPPKGRRAERLPSAPTPSFCANAWSPDGERLVGGAADRVLSFSLRDRTYETLAPGKLPVWMADSERILYLDPEAALRVVDRRTRETRVLLPPPEGSFFEGFALSPDDRWLYLLRGTEEGDLWLSR